MLIKANFQTGVTVAAELTGDNTAYYSKGLCQKHDLLISRSAGISDDSLSLHCPKWSAVLRRNYGLILERRLLICLRSHFDIIPSDMREVHLKSPKLACLIAHVR